MAGMDDARGVYSISIAAELVGTGVHNLRVYEARGLLNPSRSDGGTRRYSPNDVAVYREIGELLAAGLNLAGIEAVLALRAELTLAEQEIERLRGIIAANRAENRLVPIDSGQGLAEGPDRPAEPRRQPS